MKIVQICRGQIPVNNYGGTERVIYWLSEALADLGYDVSIIAPKDSYHENASIKVIECDNFSNVKEYIPKDTDIVHIHYNEIEDVKDFKWLLTIHGNNKANLFDNKFPENIVGISRNHAVAHNLKYFVYNGVDSREFIFNSQKQDHFLFFSKVSYRSKGIDQAIKACSKNNVKLDIYGGDRKKLLRNPKSFLTSFKKNINVKGYASGQKKAEVFSQAKALLFPIQWSEPFGLVMVEAMMSGTPVIAFNRGSVSEIVNRESGFVINYLEQMSDAMNQIGSIDPYKCREYALNNFDISVCAKNYIKQYQRVISTT
ncbi:glycosyltransferase family 4 protein [Francisella sp. 19X1-34]|uniref:glycosyltransferase family 4 protein n=1 Tax=Francisella sp. 19X1-34 TaxID=3087177 RepID=UPI002E31FD38|nr:glycosyltransferase family 4 protein [Francisella sp. 19X1-34]MED7788577.1 glycosyltransferase family 4 protein [Francisella sp. 19X1-34]